MNTYESKAIAKLNEGIFVTWLRGGVPSKYSTAAELYEKAAIEYRRDKDNDHAAICYEKSGECLKIINNRYNAATMYVEASKSYKKLNSTLR